MKRNKCFDLVNYVRKYTFCDEIMFFYEQYLYISLHHEWMWGE
jgi:hypothetical protein